MKDVFHIRALIGKILESLSVSEDFLFVLRSAITGGGDKALTAILWTEWVIAALFSGFPRAHPVFHKSKN